ncbi:MAG TPA: hypothetical protein DFR83_16425, partial [Deltaproteobacteria bacterium]|nr:hypothetical protein [Deltaproteobacteria bacterium]
MSDSPRSPLLNLLLGFASLVVVFAGLQAAGQILLPVLFSVFLAVLCQPIVRFLTLRKVPRVLAVVLVVLVLASALVGLTVLLGDSVRRFTATIPQYQGRLEQLVENTLALLTRWNVVPPSLDETATFIDPGALLNAVGQTLSAVLTILSRLFIVVIFTAFILLEASELDQKVRVVFGADSRLTRSLLDGSATVQRYLAIKTGASLVTGLLVGSVNAALGLDFAVLWGVVAFLFNYIPSIGSIVAALPPLLLSAVQLGPVPTLVIAITYLAVNVSIGNIL